MNKTNKILIAITIAGLAFTCLVFIHPEPLPSGDADMSGVVYLLVGLPIFVTGLVALIISLISERYKPRWTPKSALGRVVFFSILGVAISINLLFIYSLFFM